MNSHAVITNQLTRCYGRLEAVNRLNLEVPKRSIYALLGPNGAGKSTTFSILINALQPSSGKAFVLGKESSKLNARDFRRIGYVAESQEIPAWMTGKQLIDFFRPLYPNWDESFCLRLHETLDVPLNRKIKHMSRGEQMKLRLLTSMAYRPELLILDEPFSGLDPLVRDELSDGLLNLVGEGDWTVILASHDVDEVERLSDHVGFISKGKMQFSESVDSLQSRFRGVSARFADEVSNPRLQRDWMCVETSGNELRFVDAAYDEAACRRALESCGALAGFEARPLSLREIFVATSRQQRDLREVGR